MIGIPRSLRVLLAGSASVALVATGVTALLATPAHAEAASQARIEAVYPTDGSISAGTCAIYRVVPTTPLGVAPSDSKTVVITLTESPASKDQDVDFCTPPAAPDGQTGTRVTRAHYDSATPANPMVDPTDFGEQYCTGRSITPPAAGGCTASPDRPDVASDADVTTDPQHASNTTNPTDTDQAYDFGYTADSHFVEFGIVGQITGGATIDACLSDDTDCSDTGDIKAAQVKVSFTPGGPPQSTAAYDAVTNIAPDRTSYTATLSPATPAPFVLTLTNNNADTDFGVTPNYRVDSGPNFGATIRSCGESDDFGVSRCSYSGAQPGTDTITFWVNHSGTLATGGPDAGEPTATVTVTTYAQPAAAASARFIDLTPNTPTSQAAGTTKPFVATVTDNGGAPVQGAVVTFEETGPGQFVGGTSADGLTSTITVNTGPDGRATASILVQPGEKGSDVITAKLSTTGSQCGQNFNGQTGTCQDTTTNTVTGGASASPTPTSTASPTRTATPTATATPSATGSGGRRNLTISTPTPDIQPTDDGVLNAFGQPNASVELRCYTRPDTNYFTARGPSNLSSSGALQFVIHPGANTRCYVRYTGDEVSASPSVIINVHTTLSLSAYRDGVRKYHFQGTNLPRRAGQLITLYRWARRDTNGYCDPHIAAGDYSASSSDPNCVAVRTATATTNSTNTWRIDRSFTGSGQFVFQVRTSQTLTNANGVSNPRLTIIH
ncbi:MAG: hypothetical protein QOJ79_683 [Actinomycetota bacterium]|jgi:hypothetical protein|nr:hypothetical protein [Actinomycetota bacterium]